MTTPCPETRCSLKDSIVSGWLEKSSNMTAEDPQSYAAVSLTQRALERIGADNAPEHSEANTSTDEKQED